MAKKKAETQEMPSKRRMIIHFGVQKTGSTSMQRFLNINASLLAAQMIVRTPVKSSPMRPLGQATIRFSLERSTEAADALTQAWDELLHSLPASRLPVLISHENLAGAMPGNGGETQLFPMLPEIAGILRERTSEFDVSFAYYTRAMNRWKSSVWAQAVRTDGYPKPEDDFLNEVADLPGWGDLHQRLSAAVGQENVHRFKLEDEADRLRPGQQLLALAGLSDDDRNGLESLNALSMPRLSPAATEFLRCVNALNLNPYPRNRVADLVVHNQNLFDADYRPEGTL